MLRKVYLILILTLFLVSLANASEYQYNNPTLPKLSSDRPITVINASSGGGGGSSYNATYELWSYNQTTPAIQYASSANNTLWSYINSNQASWLSTFNDSYVLRSGDNVTGPLNVAGRVGINMTNPSVALDVQGTGVFYKLGIGTNPSAANHLMITGAGNVITTSISASNTYNGTGAAVRAMIFTMTYNGSNANPNIQGTNNNIVYNGNSTGRVLVSGGIFSAGLTNTKRADRETFFLIGVDAGIQSAVNIQNHTGANFSTISVFAADPPDFLNATRQTSYGILSEGDVGIFANKKLLFEGNETVKGNTYFSFNSTRNITEFYLKGWRRMIIDNQTISFYNRSNYTTFIIATGNNTVYAENLLVKSGDSSNSSRVGGTYFVNMSDANNSAAAEQTLYSNHIGRNVFSRDGDSIEVDYAIISAGSGTATSQYQIYFNGTRIYDSTAVGFTLGTTTILNVKIIRNSATSVEAFTTATTTTASAITYAQVTEVTGLNFANTNLLNITGTRAGVGASANDINAKYVKEFWWPS